MSEQEIRMMRLVQQAYSVARSVAQDIETRALVIVPLVGGQQRFEEVGEARAWLRHYAECGRFGRQCFQRGCACGACSHG